MNGYRGDGEIDVIVPVYNGGRYIGDCITSLLSQTLMPRRIIVVDDGSTDDTVEVVSSIQKSNPAVTLHGMGRNFGVSAARNAGIGLSDAAFIAFIDADDIWMPSKLALQMQIFNAAAKPVGFVHSSFFLIDEAGNRLARNGDGQPLLSGNVFSKLLWEGNVLSGSASSVLIRREVLDRAGLFDDQLHYAEDWDLWLRLAAISAVGHTSEAVVGVRIHQQSAQLGLKNRIDRFFQTMSAYSHWETVVRNESGLLRKLREDGFLVLLTSTRNPRDAYSFYRRLKTSGQNLTRELYAGQWDFWSGLLMAAIRGAGRRLVRLVVKSPLQDPGRIKVTS